MYFIPDLTELEQSSDNSHYLWNDIQFSKGQLNKDRKIEVEIGGKKENVYYRTAPCIGVKTCTVSGCTYIAPIREKHPCPHHKNKLVKSEGCPVEFVYVCPEDGQDKRRWIGGLVSCQKYMAKNLHNHLPHAAMKISQCVEERIHHSIASNPTLTPTDIACGDITYNETREYPYIFNAGIFNYTTMEWMVIGRIRMNKQDSNAYALAFRKLFSKIQADHPHYSVGETLLGLVVDWSDAKIKGLQHAIGKEKAEQLH